MTTVDPLDTTGTDASADPEPHEWGDDRDDAWSDEVFLDESPGPLYLTLFVLAVGTGIPVGWHHRHTINGWTDGTGEQWWTWAGLAVGWLIAFPVAFMVVGTMVSMIVAGIYVAVRATARRIRRTSGG